MNLTTWEQSYDLTIFQTVCRRRTDCAAYLMYLRKNFLSGNEIRMEKPSYARLFETGHAYGGIIANVYQPSDTLTPFRRYFLYEKGAEIPAGLPDGIIPVKVPLEKAGCAHVTQIGFLSALGVADRIKSVGAKAYLEKNSVLENREDLGEFFNGWQFDIEKLLSLNPDGVFFSPGGNEDLSSVENKVPSPMLLDMSPWETHPLARTEWVKFAAEFFCLRDRADSLFSAIEKRYIDVKSKASSSGSSPLRTLFTALSWRMVHARRRKLQKRDVPGCRTTFSLGRQQRHRLACPGFRNGNEQRFRCPGMVFRDRTWQNANALRPESTE